MLHDGHVSVLSQTPPVAPALAWQGEVGAPKPEAAVRCVAAPARGKFPMAVLSLALYYGARPPPQVHRQLCA